jgi:sigma-B regulation protein RsbU (phosphoserine phosphatase)
VMIGDVTGHGVPAALVTATVEGCCETAQRLLGSGFHVFDLMQLLNRSVLDVGKSEYLMSCFAAVIDADEMAVTFANAGHPFPYLCRPGELRALVSRGMPLGVEAEPTIAVARMDLNPKDVIVLFTDALVESENAEGKRYGDRGLQRALRRRAAGAGARACHEIMDDALLHYGERPIREDITLVCVTVGA